jgi:hypothetical protein
MIDVSEVKSTIEMLDKADAANWDAPGKPKLEVVQRLMGTDKVTADHIAFALGDGGTKAKADGTGIAPTSKPIKPGAMHGATADDDKAEQIGPPVQPDRLEVMKATAAKAEADKKAALAVLDEKKRDVAKLAAEIAAGEKTVSNLDIVIENNIEQISDAEVVKRIQAQTQARLTIQAENNAKVKEVLKLRGPQAVTPASPLDAALMAGAKRSKVMVNGKVFEAPHPRSPDGVRAYAGWVHNGQKRPE